MSHGWYNYNYEIKAAISILAVGEAIYMVPVPYTYGEDQRGENHEPFAAPFPSHEERSRRGFRTMGATRGGTSPRVLCLQSHVQPEREFSEQLCTTLPGKPSVHGFHRR